MHDPTEQPQDPRAHRNKEFEDPHYHDDDEVEHPPDDPLHDVHPPVRRKPVRKLPTRRRFEEE